VAVDGEFVSVQAERVELNAEGQRVVREEGRQLLARISLIDGRVPVNSNLNPNPEFRLLVDDYILPTEPVLDYVTRFSGLTEEDLNPTTSRHAVVPYRTAYLKLRYFIDAGCVLVGHGLQNDFETANICVPPGQVRDTVELWRLPNQRKISLRFLAAYLLRADIQDEIHDSIEDAKTSLLLYRHYEATRAQGPEHLHATLQELYAYGARTNWTIGIERVKP
jgi:PAB-dependent poly(A)-specific ribonuclease subunit 2